MTPLAGRLRRLSGRPPRAILGRLGQMARAGLERLGVDDSARRASIEDLLGELGGDPPPAGAADFLDRFRDRLAEGPLAAFRDPRRTLAAIRSRWPDAGRRALERATRIEAGRFDLLGYEGLDFGDPIEWAYDPVHDIRAPGGHWSLVPYLDPSAVGDHKIVWELNRHQYFVDLGRAYWHTGEERWARLFAAHVKAWMKANPPKRGINWASSLELGFRAISWLWALCFFARSPTLTPELFTRMVAWLRVHGTHVERYVSTWFSPNTHLTGEALALVYLGALLPELPEAARWSARGRRWLLDALDAQVRPDGGYFEQSTHYHRYTADFYLHLGILSRWGEGGAEAPERVEALLDHLAGLTRPDGLMPRIGDEDGGRLLFLDDRRLSDPRSTLLTAALLFGRKDWSFVAGEPSEEPVWLLGPDALERRAALGAEPPAYLSRAFPDTGLYVTRSGWDGAADYAVVRCGPHGALSGGHAHADALSFELSEGGVPLLVETGTGSFVDHAVRETLRATSSHNAVSVGGRSSSEPAGPFGWGARARSRVEAWLSRASFTFFRGSHDGFDRLSPGLRHTRTLLWVRDGCWLLRDRLDGASDVPAAAAHFWLAPGLEGELEAGQGLTVRDRSGDPVATLYALEGAPWDAVEGIVAPGYGRLERAVSWRRRPVVEGGGDSGAVGLWTLIVKGRAPAPERLELEVGRGWRLGAGDLLLAGEGGEGVRARDGSLEADFDWLWLRPAPDGGWARALGLEGRRVAVDDREPIDFPEAVRYFLLGETGEVEAERQDGSAVARSRPERPVRSA